MRLDKTLSGQTGQWPWPGGGDPWADIRDEQAIVAELVKVMEAESRVGELLAAELLAHGPAGEVTMAEQKGREARTETKETATARHAQRLVNLAWVHNPRGATPALAIGLSPLEKGLKRGLKGGGLAPCRGPFGRAGERANKRASKRASNLPCFLGYK